MATWAPSPTVWAAFLICITSTFAEAGSDKVETSTSQLPSAVHQVAWLGHVSNSTCDSKCKKECLGLTGSIHPRGASSQGNRANHQADTCLASCGCGGGADVVIVSTASGSAHISRNGGSSWYGLESMLPLKAPRSGSIIEKMHVSPADPAVAIVLTNSTTSYLTSDGARTWTLVNISAEAQNGAGKVPLRIGSWKWHPTENNWALALELPESSARTSTARLEVRRAFYTRDAGKSWSPLPGNVDQVHWAVSSGGSVNRILVVRRVGDAQEVEVVMTSDFMQSYVTLLGKNAAPGVPRGAMRLHVHGVSLVAIVEDGAIWDKNGKSQWQISLWTAFIGDDSQVPVFREASWPSNAAPPTRRQLVQLRILYAVDHLTLLFVPLARMQLPWGHVLGYSPNSQQLQILLTNVHHPGSISNEAAAGVGGLDWNEISGIQGAFIANRFVLDDGLKDLDGVETRLDEQAPQQSESLDFGESEITEPSSYVIRSYVSMDMGYAWQPLQVDYRARSRMEEAFPKDCTDTKTSVGTTSCTLHLGQIESATAAPGIILGVGNVGRQLSSIADRHNVFLSRNGGLLWKPVLVGPHSVSIIGRGDVLLAASLKSPARISYSADGGETWQKVEVATATSSTVGRGMFTHPSHMELQNFLLLGSDTSSAITIAAMNFSRTLTSGACKVPTLEGDFESDLEKWSPADSLEDAHVSKRSACVLGVRTRYVRRKLGRACSTANLGSSPLSSRTENPCECGAADWVCDAGYHRARYAPSAGCDPLDGTSVPNATAMCEATTLTNVLATRGYAKAPGNRCVGGVDFSPRTVACANNMGFSGMIRSAGAGAHAFYFKYIWVLIAAGALVYKFHGNESCQRCIIAIKPRHRKKYDDEEACDDEEAFLLSADDLQNI